MTVIQCSATAEAAEKILKKAKPFAAEFLECDLSEIEFEDGIFRRVNTNKTISIEYLSKILFNIIVRIFRKRFNGCRNSFS